MSGLTRAAAAVALAMWALAPVPVLAGERTDAQGSENASLRNHTYRPLTLPSGALELAFGVEVNLARNNTGEPVSVALDARYGLTDSWTLALIHSHDALGEIGSGYGLCLTGPSAGCPSVYRALAVGARYRMAGAASWELAADTALGFRDVDPVKPAWHIGATSTLRAGVFTVLLAPSLRIGLANVERGNRAALELPIWLRIQAGPVVAFGVRTGLRGELRHFGEVYAVPAGVGAWVAMTPWLELGVEVVYPRLLGPLNTVALRELWVAFRVVL